MSTIRKETTMALLLASLLWLTACERNSRYSPLDGLWQVLTVEDLHTGQITEANSQLYYSFEWILAQLTFYPAERTEGFMGHEFLASFTEDGESIHFGRFYIYREEDTPAPDDELALFGIINQPASFHMTREKQRLVLRNDDAIVTLRRY